VPGVRRALLITTLALTGAVASVLVSIGVPAPIADAATCADYPNQAAAQRAADTRDADGDGIYCENLPCPCSSATGGSGGSPARKPKTPATDPMLQRVGASHTLAPGRRKGSGCHVRGPLPDRACTPGAVFSKARTSLICKAGYTGQVRDVSASVKQRVLAEYGVTDYTSKTYEIDHLVPLELGGSNSISNLFPEAAAPEPGFHEKDQVENEMHRMVCHDGYDLGEAQRQIARDWTRLYDDFIADA
jgi:hypothetical protein